MASLALLCTDGSDLAHHALAAGLRVTRPTDRTVIATVMDAVDPTLITGVSGFGGGTMSPQQFDEVVAAHRADAEQRIMDARHVLDLRDAESVVVEGAPGPALCELAAQLGATVMVAGTRGRGGLKRAVLGSVSDHLVRNAPCPIVVTGPSEHEPASDGS